MRDGHPGSGRLAGLGPFLVLTSLAWAALATATGWVLVALGWWLLARLWLRELLVPQAVEATARMTLLLLAWALAVRVLVSAWCRRERLRYHLPDRRRLRAEELLRAGGRPWPWAECVLESDGTYSVAGPRTAAPAPPENSPVDWRKEPGDVPRG
ncbi:MAG: hypothetical protein K6U08_00080 [Firmicutes bacterium]|nr:hypothetical protein [Bacillota bacterium]